jgi:hypothetical protein
MTNFKYGMMGGFKSRAEAEKCAFLATFGGEYVVLEKDGEWAWVTPPHYAKRIIRDLGARREAAEQEAV